MHPLCGFLIALFYAWVVKESGRYYYGNMANIQAWRAAVLDVAHDVSPYVCSFQFYLKKTSMSGEFL